MKYKFYQFMLAVAGLVLAVGCATVEDELRFAAKEGRTETVKALLAGGADIDAKNKDGDTALMIATLLGHTETVKALLAEGADVNSWILRTAESKDYTEIVQLLKKAGAEE
jgi:ankyrin repeat protein